MSESGVSSLILILTARAAQLMGITLCCSAAEMPCPTNAVPLGLVQTRREIKA